MKNDSDLFNPDPIPVALNLIELPKRFRDLYQFATRARQAAAEYYKTPKEPADAKKAALLNSKQREAELDRFLKRFKIHPPEDCGGVPLILEFTNKEADPADWGIVNVFLFPPGKNIIKARYQADMEHLDVLFSSGSVYRYFGTKEIYLTPIWDKWRDSPDPMDFFTKNIRTGIPYKKIS